MSAPFDTNMPGYVVFRDSPVGQPFDTTAPLAFFPPKDSDELFDALRAHFPHLKTHSERMREATIAYLIQERADEQSSMAPMSTPQTANTAITSPWLDSFPSMSTDSSNFSSPDMLGLATPSFSNSPQPSAARQPSTAASAVPNSITPPALEQMTGVFSLCDSTQPKQHVRRKMTEAEKAEYRKRRIVKACDKCSKRKRKCVHNQPEMENLAKPTKVAKAKPAAHQKKAAVVPTSLSPDSAPDGAFDSQPFIQGDDWLDFTLMDDPMPEMTFDDLLSSDLDKPLKDQQYLHFQQPWGMDEDFMFANNAPLPPQQDPSQFGFQADQQRERGVFGDLHGNASTTNFTLGNKKYPVGIQPQQHLPGVEANGILWDGPDVQQHVLGRGTQPHAASMQRKSLDATSGDALTFSGRSEGSVGESSSHGGRSAPRKELTRNIKNPIAGDVLHDLFDDGDRHMHQSEATSKPPTDGPGTANGRNRANVRNAEGTGVQDLLQSATAPHRGGSRFSQGEATGPEAADAAAEDRQVTANEGNRANFRNVESTGVQGVVPSASLHRGGPRFSQGEATGPEAANAAAVDRSADGSSVELYRLKHRVRALQTRAQPSQTNDAADKTPASLTGLSAILPPATRPSNSGTDAENATHAEAAHAASLSHSSRPRAHARSPLAVPTSATPTAADLHEINSTHRCRDHFGRVLFAAILAALLLCFAAPSTLLLAPRVTDAEEEEKSSEGKRRSISAAAKRKCDKFVGWVMTPHSSLRWSVWC